MNTWRTVTKHPEIIQKLKESGEECLFRVQVEPGDHWDYDLGQIFNIKEDGTIQIKYNPVGIVWNIKPGDTITCQFIILKEII